MVNSLWSREDLQADAADPNNPFINKAVVPGVTLKLTLVDILPKTRPDDTKIGKPGDTFQMICCVDAEGRERTIDQNSPKGAFMSSLRNADVGLGESFNVSRTGVGIETKWNIVKLAADGTEIAPVLVPSTSF